MIADLHNGHHLTGILIVNPFLDFLYRIIKPRIIDPTTRRLVGWHAFLRRVGVRAGECFRRAYPFE